MSKRLGLLEKQTRTREIGRPGVGVGQLDEAAFSAFYGSHARALWAYVYRVTGNGADADDIVQEAFLRLLRAGPDTDDAEQRRRFLYRVASNLVVDRWRMKKRNEPG